MDIQAIKTKYGVQQNDVLPGRAVSELAACCNGAKNELNKSEKLISGPKFNEAKVRLKNALSAIDAFYNKASSLYLKVPGVKL